MENEIPALLENRHGMMTYHIANCLCADHPRYRHIETSRVLRCMKRMEKAGRVERVKSPYGGKTRAPAAEDQPTTCGD